MNGYAVQGMNVKIGNRIKIYMSIYNILDGLPMLTGQTAAGANARFQRLSPERCDLGEADRERQQLKADQVPRNEADRPGSPAANHHRDGSASQSFAWP